MRSYGLQVIDTTIVGDSGSQAVLRKSQIYSYTNVYNNIIKMAEYSTVVVSINLCKVNIGLTKQTLASYLGYRNLPIYFTFNRIVSYDNNPCTDIELDVDTYMLTIIDLMHWALDNGLKICDMSCFQNDGVYCSAYVGNNHTISAGLYVYQCEHHFTPENAIARIINGKLHCIEKAPCKLCIDPYATTECVKCKLLPYCNGGCSHSRNIGKSYCPDEKDFLEEYLKIYYKKYYT